MLKALLHKQMLEVRRVYFYNKRQGTMVTKKSSSVGLTILFIFIYLIMFGSFFALSFAIGEPLVKSDGAWIFFMIFTIMAFLVGILGSVLSTSSALFLAKDNEFLLAMPIPPSKILFSRMISVYIMGLIYESMVLLPAILFYYIIGHPTVLSAILCILGFFVLGFTILVFSCFFGWLVALISSKLKNKAALTVIISVLVIAVFVYFRIEANRIFRNIAEHSAEIGAAVKGWGYPIYSLGLGMSGNIVGFLVFTAITAVLFVITCIIMSKTFLRIVSAKPESNSATFSESQIRTRKVGSALRKKEMKRFTASPTYMVNCGLGLLVLVAGAIVLPIMSKQIHGFTDALASYAPILVPAIPALGAFVICLVASLCDISAPAISLEGPSIWVLQTLPVDPYDVIKAKLYPHVLLTEISALLCTISMIIVLKPNVFAAICMILCVALFVLFGAAAMLALDLKRPMLDWTSEVQPIKQGTNILFSMLGSFLIAAILGGIAVGVSLFAGSGVGLLICSVILAVLTILLHKWFRGKGRILFASL